MMGVAQWLVNFESFALSGFEVIVLPSKVFARTLSQSRALTTRGGEVIANPSCASEMTLSRAVVLN